MDTTYWTLIRFCQNDYCEKIDANILSMDINKERSGSKKFIQRNGRAAKEGRGKGKKIGRERKKERRRGEMQENVKIDGERGENVERGKTEGKGARR